MQCKEMVVQYPDHGGGMQCKALICIVYFLIMVGGDAV